MKGLAILCVLLLHALPVAAVTGCYATFHIAQAVPIFLILMGFVTGLSHGAARQARLTSPSYWREYLSRRFGRVVVPFIGVSLLSIVIGLLAAAFGHHNILYFGPRTVFGYMPIAGPGNYFVPLLFQAVLLLPLLAWCFARRPGISLAACFAVDIAFLIISRWIALFDTVAFLYSGCILRYLSALGLGLWISQDWKPAGKRGRLILVGLPLSLAYLCWADIAGGRIALFRGDWGSQNALSFFYPAALVLVGLNLLPRQEAAGRWQAIAATGRASYHIFLLQVLWFALAPVAVARLLGPLSGMTAVAATAAFLVVSTTVCLVAGQRWFQAEQRYAGLAAQGVKSVVSFVAGRWAVADESPRIIPLNVAQPSRGEAEEYQPQPQRRAA